MGSYRYEILRETTTDSLIMENNTREKKMNSNVYGIDLGTCNMKIYCKTSNKILNEKNTIALVKKDQIYAYGDAAYAMYEKAPENINVSFPVTGGVIADYNNMQTMVQEVVETSNSRYSAMMKNFQDFYDTIISNRQELAPETASVKEETEETTEKPETDDQQ